MQSALDIADSEFSGFCRRWRQYRKFSQLELALAANVSQRHLSWLETGRSKPSREMVIRLSEAFDMPLRERNAFLQAAGFSAAYSETTLDAPAMEAVLAAVRSVLDHHDPLPAVVIDRFWNIRMLNRGSELLFSVTGDPDLLWAQVEDDGSRNLARLTLHPHGLRQYLENWDQAAPDFLRRLRREASASGDAAVRAHLETLIELAGPLPEGERAQPYLMPVLPLEMQAGGLKLSLFSVISNFGTPQDITTEELRIESFYPSDEATKALFYSQ